LHAPRTREALRHDPRPRHRDVDHAAKRRAPRLARDGQPETGGRRTSDTTHKLDELATDPHVNLAYFKDRTREWISVAGLAKVSRNRETIRQLYAPDWKMWFNNGDDPRYGTPDDPRIVLIGVEVHSAVYLEVNKPQPVVLYEIVKGWLTGTEPKLGEMHTIEK
jgi:general stress protein 26